MRAHCLGWLHQRGCVIKVFARQTGFSGWFIERQARRTHHIGLTASLILCTRHDIRYNRHNRMNLRVHAEHAPPRTWEQFEELCADVFAAEWADPALVRHGRAGQRQHGVDIVARQGSRWPLGLQCKKKSRWPVKVLTASEVDKEVVEARRFRPKLCSFWILTTAPDDAGVQEHARLITDRRSRKGLFDVIVLGWGEICRRATLHAAVAAKHFGAGGALPQRPILAVWFASGGRLELTGKELELSCRELAHDLRDYPGGRLVLRQRESDALAAKLGFYEGRNFKVAEREARLLLRDKLAHNEYAESRISKGLELMLGDPTIACYLLEVYRDSGDAARAVAAFVQHELDPQKGVRKPGTFQLRVHAPDDPSISRLRYISQAQMTSILQLMESRTKRFGHVFHSETVSELPDEVRAAEAIPAIIRALLRELDNGRSLEELRKSGALQIGSWHAQIG